MAQPRTGAEQQRRGAAAPSTTTTTAQRTAAPELVTAEETALAERPAKIDALAPVQNIGTLKALFEGQRKALAAILPQHLTPDRLFTMLIMAVNRTPDLMLCTQSSVVQAIREAADLGLEIGGVKQQAWILPFNNTIKWKDPATGYTHDKKVKQATLIPGYRGLAALARQSGEVSKLEANAVRENDHFEIEFGSNAKLCFRPNVKGERGKTIGYYAYIRLKDGQEMADFMDRADVERIRKTSKQPDSLMWTHHFDEGGRKTVFRRLAKWAPISSEKFHQAIEAANAEYDLDALSETIDITPGGSKSEDLATRLAGENGGDREPGEDDVVDVDVEEETEENATPAGRPRLTPDQIAAIDATLASAPAIQRVRLEEAFGNKLEEVEGREGEAQKDLHTRVLQAVRDLKKAALPKT